MAEDVELINKWLAALESGKYRQTTCTLTSGNGQQHCCLGVLARVAGLQTKKLGEGDVVFIYDGEHYPVNVPDELQAKAGIRGYTSSLMTMNDNDGMTFPEIAQQLRKYYAVTGVKL